MKDMRSEREKYEDASAAVGSASWRYDGDEWMRRALARPTWEVAALIRRNLTSARIEKLIALLTEERSDASTRTVTIGAARKMLSK
jgi:hypothetical protein